MTTSIDKLWQLITEDRDIINIGVFRGDREVVSKEELVEQMISALEQVRSGEAVSFDTFPDSDTIPTDVCDVINHGVLEDE